MHNPYKNRLKKKKEVLFTETPGKKMYTFSQNIFFFYGNMCKCIIENVIENVTRADRWVSRAQLTQAASRSKMDPAKIVEQNSESLYLNA